MAAPAAAMAAVSRLADWMAGVVESLACSRSALDVGLLSLEAG